MKRAICLIGILLLTAFALAACGENEEYPYTLTVKNGYIRVTESGEDVLCLDLSEVEISRVIPPRRDKTAYCYDEELICEQLRRYLPRKLFLRDREKGEQPNHKEGFYTVSLDFNDGFYCNFDMNPDGTVFFLFTDINQDESLWIVSKPGMVPYEDQVSFFEQLRSEKEEFSCEDSHSATEGTYRIGLAEDGSLVFGNTEETLYSFDADMLEHVYVYSRWLSVDQRFYRAPERYQVLPLLLPEAVWLKPVDESIQREWWWSKDQCSISVDLDGNRSLEFHVTATGRLVLIDPDGHYFATELGAYDVADFAEAIQHLSLAYNNKYYQ